MNRIKANLESLSQAQIDNINFIVMSDVLLEVNDLFQDAYGSECCTPNALSLTTFFL